jgi:hypothetical protein
LALVHEQLEELVEREELAEAEVGVAEELKVPNELAKPAGLEEYPGGTGNSEFRYRTGSKGEHGNL